MSRKDELQPIVQYFTLDFQNVTHFTGVIPATVDLPAGEWWVFSRIPFRLQGPNFNVPYTRCIRFQLKQPRKLLLYRAGGELTLEWVTFVGCDYGKEIFSDSFELTAITFTGGPVAWGAAVTSIDINYGTTAIAYSRIMNMIVDEIALWRLDANSRLTGEFTGRITEVEPADSAPTVFMDLGNPTAINRGDYDACGMHWRAGSQEQALILPVDGQLHIAGNGTGAATYLWWLIKGRLL